MIIVSKSIVFRFTKKTKLNCNSNREKTNFETLESNFKKRNERCNNKMIIIFGTQMKNGWNKRETNKNRRKTSEKRNLLDACLHKLFSWFNFRSLCAFDLIKCIFVSVPRTLTRAACIRIILFNVSIKHILVEWIGKI